MKLLITTYLLSVTTVLCTFNLAGDILRAVNSILGPNIKTVPWPKFANYDFIVVGSGAGGSTVANRLAENPNWKVLLLEAGKPEGGVNQVPMLTSFLQSTDYNWGYKAEQQSTACLGMTNRQCTWPKGKSLGGTSSINYMIHTRGNKLDYDDWEKAGNTGWSYNDILPYFKKSERFKVPGINNMTYHGTDGYLCVEGVPHQTPLAWEFLNAAKEFGYDITDYNGRRQLGFSLLQVNEDKGTRCSASKAYLRVNRSNLHIVTEAHVTKVLINNRKQVYGVQYVKNGVYREVRANKEVILSAGTLKSAQLLMLSGIGPQEHLEELGIKVIKDSRVGYNLYEHIGFLGLTFTVDEPITLLLRRLLKLSTIAQWANGGHGLLSIPGGAEAIGFIRTKYATDSRPDMELLFCSISIASDDGTAVKRGYGVSDETYNTVWKPLEGRDAYTIWPIVLNPKSYGRTKLRSKNPFHAPIIEPNFFTHPADIETLLEGIKFAINISSTEPFLAHGSRIHTIKVPGCARFDFGSDDYWRCAARQVPALMHHEIGTVKMGPKSDKTSVVNPRLKVIGVTGLRVVDASIMPKIPAAHTNAVVYMIGEKAADMIKEDWA